jgi:hypothetical protein
MPKSNFPPDWQAAIEDFKRLYKRAPTQSEFEDALKKHGHALGEDEPARPPDVRRMQPPGPPPAPGAWKGMIDTRSPSVVDPLQNPGGGIVGPQELLSIGRLLRGSPVI